MAHPTSKQGTFSGSSTKIREQENARLKGYRILVVEDAPDNRELFSFLLELEGASVETAIDGREGVEKTHAVRPDLVLMDIQMPGMDGYEATSELRRTGYRGPVVALTAHSLPEERERSRQAGYDAYVTKPIDIDQLIELIRHQISNRAH